MRSRTICIIFLFLSISGLIVAATAPTAEGMTETVGLYAKTTAGVWLSGVKVTLAWGFSLLTLTTPSPTIVLPDGMYTFTAPMSVTVSGVKYNFVRWDSVGYTVSTSNSFTYALYSCRDFYAIYAQPQGPPTTTPQGYKPPTTSRGTTPSTSCGYIEYMMGQCQGQTTTTTTGTTRTTQTAVMYTAPHPQLYTVYLTVKSQLGVDGWKIYVDGSYVGTTDSQGTLKISMTYGYHKLDLKKGVYYATYYEYYVNSDGQQLILTVT